MENKTKHKPVRMCVICKGRFFQADLFRLQCVNKKIIKWKGSGRSFYVCSNCIKDKKLIKYISRLCKISKENAKEQIICFQM